MKASLRTALLSSVYGIKLNTLDLVKLGHIRHNPSGSEYSPHGIVIRRNFVRW